MAAKSQAFDKREIDKLSRAFALQEQADKPTSVIKYLNPKKFAEVIHQVDPDRIAFDIASEKFRAYFSDGEKAYNFELKRKDALGLLNYLSKGTIVAFEACGSSQDLGRTCLAMSLEPHILPAGLVSAIRGAEDKSDAADAAAIYRTDLVVCNDPNGYKKLGIIKTEEEQGLASLVAQREALVVEKVAKENQLGALCREFGYCSFKRDVSMPAFAQAVIFNDVSVSEHLDQSARSIFEQMDVTDSRETDLESLLAESKRKAIIAFFAAPLINIYTLPIPFKVLCLYLAYRSYWEVVIKLDSYNNMIAHISKQDERCKRLQEIPGVGPLSSVVLTASLGPAVRVLENAGAAAKYIGVVPAHTGTGGKTTILSMSKQGLHHAKRVLFQCGMSVLSSHIKKAKMGLTSWVIQLLERGKNRRLVAGAIANKIVRLAYALLRDDSHYDPEQDVHFTCTQPEFE